MLFNSINFAIFLPVVFLLYWFATKKSLKLQNLLLLIASYFFYACWDWRFLFLLFFSTFLDYFTGIRMAETNNQKVRRFWLWLSILINLGFLGFFKYYNFFADSFAHALSHLGINSNPWTLEIILPIGISFYTFHGLSYVIDVYKNKIKAERNFIDYAVFVSFFPLLIAGPIERATHLLPQIKDELLRSGGRVAGPDVIDRADLVVDGLLGIGGRGGLRAPADAWAKAVAAAGAPVVAVDLPSGVDADTGLVHDASIAADVTVTFGGLKIGLVSGGGAAAAGEVRLVDIGLAPHLPEPTRHVLGARDVAAWLPNPGAGGDKYTRGVVGIVAGSAQYAGAGMLATGSAVHGGAGMVRYLGGAPQGVVERYPEVVVHPGAAPHEVRVQSFVVGPGLGTDDDALAKLRDVLGSDVPVIVDADAITLLAQHDDARAALRARTAPTVLTPHDREFTRLFDLDDDRVESTRRAAAAVGATVLLKGNATVVAEPDGTVYLNRTGTPWLGTAGSGDVLSGLIGSLLAAGLPAGRAAAVGAFVHGVAGQLAAADGPPAAEDVLLRVRAAWREIATTA